MARSTDRAGKAGRVGRGRRYNIGEGPVSAELEEALDVGVHVAEDLKGNQIAVKPSNQHHIGQLKRGQETDIQLKAVKVV